MIRRELIMFLGSAAVAWPLAARAQQPRMPVIGFLGLGSPSPNSPRSIAFHQGLAEAGYVPGKNVAIEYSWANNQTSLLPRLAAELVARQVDVIVTTGSRFAALAAKAATSTIPIVFVIAEDPVKYGLVASFSRPGGNVTGVTAITTELAAKRLDLLRQLVPQATTIGYLSGPSGSLVFEDMRSDMLAAGRALGREIIVLEVRSLEFDHAFVTLVEEGAGALIVGNYLIFTDTSNGDKILELAARHKIPAIYPRREHAVNGGLMSYDSDPMAVARLFGSYAGLILKGAKPADLPVQRPTKFEFVINLKTAKALDLSIPRALLAGATELID
jgi:putative ABC transport system substrate-binding protein